MPNQVDYDEDDGPCVLCPEKGDWCYKRACRIDETCYRQHPTEDPESDTEE